MAVRRCKRSTIVAGERRQQTRQFADRERDAEAVERGAVAAGDGGQERGGEPEAARWPWCVPA